MDLFFCSAGFCVGFSGRVFVSGFVFGVIRFFGDGFLDRNFFGGCFGLLVLGFWCWVFVSSFVLKLFVFLFFKT